MKYDITVEIQRNPKAFAQILNEMAEFAEGNEPPPDHWEPGKRREFYRLIRQNLTSKAKAMVGGFSF